MPPKRDPVPRARDAWVWLGGLALLGVLGAGVTAAAVALWENIDIRQLVPQLAAAPPPLPQPQPPAEAAREGASFQAVLFDSPRNRAFFPDSSYYPSVLAEWGELIREAGGLVRNVGSAAELRELEPDVLLVLAEAPCLSDGELATIRAHLRRSGNVVANWAVGARDEDCEWRGWETVSELTGAEDVREIPAREALFLTVPSGIALSPGLDPGTRIELRPDPSLALRMTGPRVYWSDWALNPMPDESGGGADAAAWSGRSEFGGRVAWFGLRIGQAVTTLDDLRLRRLVLNGIRWAAGSAQATVAPWPEGRRAALVVTLDVEDEPRNAIGMADLLRSADVPGTFYVVSQLVQPDAELARALSSAGEIGSQTSDHTPVAGLTSQDQRVRLRRSSAEITDWTGIEPRGLHPPEDRFDTNTLEAWASAGGSYVLATNEARSASPEIHTAGSASIVLLPRLLKDDYNIIVQDRVIRAGSLADAFYAGMSKYHALGALAIVSSHTQIMRPGARIDALAALLDSVRIEGDWWVTRAGDVADWWRARSEVRLRFVPAEPFERPGFEPAGISDLLVEAPATRPIDGLWIDVVAPEGVDSMLPLIDGQSVDFAAAPWGLRVPVGSLPPAGARRITFLLPSAEEGGAPEVP